MPWWHTCDPRLVGRGFITLCCGLFQLVLEPMSTHTRNVPHSSVRTSLFLGRKTRYRTEWLWARGASVGSRRATQQRNTGRWLTSYSHFAGYDKAAQAVRDPAGTRDGFDDPVPYAGKEGRLDLPRGGMPFFQASVVSRKFMALQRVPRGLWQGASPPGMVGSISKGRNTATGPVGRALREIAMHATAALWPLQICQIFTTDHALH